MEDRKMVAGVEYGTPKESPWKKPKGKFVPGAIERKEEHRAKIIDTNVSIRENIERRLKNYLYY